MRQHLTELVTPVSQQDSQNRCDGSTALPCTTPERAISLQVYIHKQESPSRSAWG